MLAKLTSNYAFLCVGSLPFTNADDAATFLLERPLLMPFWPELPNLGHAELMLERAKRAQQQNWNGYLESEASGLFALKKKQSARSEKFPLLKGQVAGPLTCLRFLGQTSSISRLDEFAEVALRQIQWQAEFVSDICNKFLVVLDEPALTFWPQVSESDKTIVCDVYERILKKLHPQGIFVGIHSCKSISPEILDLSFDLYSFEWSIPEDNVELLAQSFVNACNRGAVLAPGVVPAVWGSDINSGIVEGVESARRASGWLKAVNSNRDHKLLWSATCGQAFATPSWVNALYTKEHWDAIDSA
jgi:hypothetical protein